MTICCCGCNRFFSQHKTGRTRKFFNSACRKRSWRNSFVPSLERMTGRYWHMTFDGDKRAFELFSRHYTFNNRKRRVSSLFAGKGERLVLVLSDYSGVFVWRFTDFDHSIERGVCCSLFRNESDFLSSDLILDAEELAFRSWPGTKRFYTYVNDRKIKSPNPGYCFKMAGWSTLPYRSSKNDLVILEKIIVDQPLDT